MSRLVVVSNRVNVPRQRQKPQAGGLAVALAGALAECGGLWFGWDGQTSAAPPQTPAWAEVDGIGYATTPLSTAEHEHYYMGFANSVLWPLCHFMPGRMRYRRDDRSGYMAVNRRFADQIAQLLRGDELIWVHDYHLAPLAAELRALGVQQPLGFFLHIPFPSFGLLRALPDWRDWLEALAQFDVIGVQTPEDRRALDTALVYGLGGRMVDSGVQLGGRTVRTMARPVGVEVDELAATAAATAHSRRVQRLLASLGRRELMIGVERLDYSKGLPNRLDAYEHFLVTHPRRQGRTVFMQIASPSREDIGQYADLQATLESKAGHINGRYADFDWVPVRYLHKTFARGSLLGFFRTARVGLVTPLRDGMNLVAKEFVAAQDPHAPGVLVLSELAGAADELDAAVQVNPNDTEGMAAAMEQALTMPADERRARWLDMITVLRAHSLDHWWRGCLRELEATKPD